MSAPHIFGLATLLAIGSAGHGAPSGNRPVALDRADQAVLASQAAWHRAYAAGDEAALARLLASNATIVESDGDQLDKAAILNRATVNEPIALTLTSSQERVQRRGNLAVVTSTVLERRGTARLEFRVTDVFALERDGWRLAASHWTRTGGELAEVALAPAALERMAGAYRTPRGAILRLARRGGRMEVTEPSGQVTKYVPLSETVIMAPSNKVRWVFISDAGGAVTHAVVANQYSLTTLTKVSPSGSAK